MKKQPINLASIKGKLSRNEMKSIGGGATTTSNCFVCSAGFGTRECIEYADGNIRFYCKQRYGSAMFYYVECAPGECEI